MSSITEIAYDDLLIKLPELSSYNLSYVADWSEITSSFKYFLISDEDGNNQGVFTLYFSKRKGMLHVSNPPFFQNCGLWVSKDGKNRYYQNSHAKKVLRSLAEFLANYKWVNISLPAQVMDTQPLSWAGISCLVRHTYELDTNELPDFINGSKGLRAQVKKIRSEQIDYLPELNTEGIALIHKSSLANRNSGETDFANAMLAKLKAKENFKPVQAKNSTGSGVAVGVTVGDSLVYLFGGSDKPEGVSLGTASLVKLFEIAQSLGVKSLDFEGSMIPGVERYFRSFGAELKPYYNLTKEPFLLRLKSALNL